MLSDDGGVGSAASSSRILRARSRRGTFPGPADAAFRAAGRRALLGFRFAPARLAATFRAPLGVLGRLADRILAAVFFLIARRGLAVRLALRLAIVECAFEP